MSKMPVLFVGHGSPMNAIEDNDYSRTWKKLGEHIAKPEVILSVSAHWYTKGTKIMNTENPKTIYDMYGFPEALYEVVYDVLGSPKTAERSKDLISREARYDNTWGIDHGTWSVLNHMYPKKDIPVIQISVDAEAPPEVHYQIGRELNQLRQEGVLLFGSGNIVHNLRLMDWQKEKQGFEWAYDFDEFIYQSILDKNHEAILNYKDRGESARLAVPTPDHFYPLLYMLGAAEAEDQISIYNKSCEMGSLSMTAYLWE